MQQAGHMVAGDDNDVFATRLAEFPSHASTLVDDSRAMPTRRTLVPQRGGRSFIRGRNLRPMRPCRSRVCHIAGPATIDVWRKRRALTYPRVLDRPRAQKKPPLMATPLCGPLTRHLRGPHQRALP